MPYERNLTAGGKARIHPQINANARELMNIAAPALSAPAALPTWMQELRNCLEQDS